MGNCLSKVLEGYLERVTRWAKSGNYAMMPSFQEFQAVVGRNGFNRVITTPISDRFPACACDLMYSTSGNKFVYGNAPGSLR